MAFLLTWDTALVVYGRFLFEGIEPETQFRELSLSFRTLEAFVKIVASTVGWNAIHFKGVFFLTKGIKVAIDDDFINHMEEGQKMVISIVVTETASDPQAYDIFVWY